MRNQGSRFLESVEGILSRRTWNFGRQVHGRGPANLGVEIRFQASYYSILTQ